MTVTRRVRMVDVAQAAGVSRTTASFVLNGRDAGIPPETRERVLEAAHRMGYRRHATAHALATGRTYRMGIVLNDPDSFSNGDMYIDRVLDGVTSGAVRHNYNLLLHSAHYPDWQALYADILSGAADGVLLVGRYTGDELTPALLETGFPTVCISYNIDHAHCYSVDCDNAGGTYQALRYLIDLGHRQIAFFYPGQGISWGRERFQGACRALEEAGLPRECLHLFDWLETRNGQYEEWMESAIRFLIASDPRCTAVVCCEEARVRNLVESLPQAGVRVPEDLSVISFNSTEVSARCRPPLTSVWQPMEQIGGAAVDLLVDLIEKRKVPERQRRFPMRLDVRESCVVPPQLAF